MTTDLPALSSLLVELLIKSGIVIAIGFALISAFRQASPEWKHRLLLRAFGAAILIPVILLFPRWEILPKATADPLPEITTTVESTSQNSFSKPFVSPSVTKAAAEMPWHPSWQEVFSFLWLLGVVILLLRLVVAGIQLRRFSRSAKQPSQRIRDSFESLVTPLSSPPVALHLSDRVSSPFSHGIFHPQIYLPTSAETWSDEELDMIFRHELSHVNRRDALAVLLSRIFLAANWINPLAWIANRFAIRFREEACDESVLAAGHAPTAYAEMLFCQAHQRNDRFLSTCATSMAETGTIEQRIQMILKPESTLHRQPSHLAKFAAAAFTLLFLLIGFVGSQTTTFDGAKNDITTTLKKTILPNVEFNETPLKDALRFLSQKGGGINIILNAPDAADTLITLRLTRVPLAEALRYTTSLAGLQFQVDNHAVVITPEPTESGKAPIREANGKNATQQKLNLLVVPTAEFKQTPLKDLLPYLQQRSVELDTAEKDPAKRGVNIILEKPEKAAAATVTLKVRNIPLGDLLRYVGDQTGFEYIAERHAVVFRPKQ